MKHESIRSAFDWNTGEPSIFRPLQTAANIRAASTRKVEESRASGKDLATISGLSKRSDLLLSQRRKYSTPIEGAEAGQRSADRRDAIRRGGI